MARGWNASGQLGDGTLAEKYAPVQVLGLGGAGLLTGIAGVAAGWEHTVAW